MAGTHAEVRELLTLAEAIPEAGHGVFELALNHREVPEDMDWLRELARHRLTHQETGATPTGRVVVLRAEGVAAAPRRAPLPRHRR